MKNYTSTVSAAIAAALKERGIKISSNTPTYADVFDWFMENDLYVHIEVTQESYLGEIHRLDGMGTYVDSYFGANVIKTWKQVADETIIKALKHIK